MNTIRSLFKNKKVSNFYITAGYPDLNTFKQILITLSDAGADVIEIGIPFSDPIADGEVIQKSTLKALSQNVDIEKISKVLISIKNRLKSKLIFMSYYNPVYVYGEEKFIKLAKKSNVAGVIIPDLPFDEGKIFYRSCMKQGLETILLATSVTPLNRIKAIAKYTSGFMYFVSVLGTTGVRTKIPNSIKSKLKEIRDNIKLPVCLGFGISSKESIKPFYNYIDGVIIGSALIKLIDKSGKNKKLLKQKVTNFVKSINKGLQGKF
jgi:tryptophan synthase alpha chain